MTENHKPFGKFRKIWNIFNECTPNIPPNNSRLLLTTSRILVSTNEFQYKTVLRQLYVKQLKIFFTILFA